MAIPIFGGYAPTRKGGQPNGPRPTPTTGRNRNTTVNNAGKKRFIGMAGGLVPPVSPDTAIGSASALAANEYDYLAKLAGLRQQKAQLRGTFISDRAQAREDRIAGAVGAESAALQSGGVGSSGDLMARGAVVAQEAEQVAAARAARNAGLLGVAQEKLGAQSEYYMTAADIENQRRVEQALTGIQMFQDNTYDAVQQDYGSIFRSILEAIQNQKSGRAPRRRRGVYDRVLAAGGNEEAAARIANLIRRGL